MATFSTAAWLTGADARRMTAMNHYSLMRLAALGEIRVKADRGDSLKYRREDIEMLAKSATVEATD